MDEVADPIILAWQLGATDGADWGHIESLANYLVSNGPTTPQEQWEENGGYSPATMAAEIAGLICAASIAETNGATSQAATYQSTALSWAAEVDSTTYTTSGSYGTGPSFPRITPDGSPNSGSSISIANGGGSHDDRTVVDPSFLELVRLGIKAATATDITSTLSVVDSGLKVTTPERPVWHRYNFDGYGETSSGGDYTGSGTGNPWPVLTGERGEYDVAAGNLSGAQSLLAAMAGAANSGYQIPEQVWGGTTGTGGFTFGQPDNSSTPLMWAMAQYVRLAVNISAGKDVDTPAVVTQCVQQGACPVSGSVKETVNVTVPVNTDASGDPVYLAGNLSALGLGQSEWAANGVPMTRVSATRWTATVEATADATLSYKYDLGGSWSNVEKNAACADIGNRSMSVNGGTENDTVANWGGPGACGDSTAVINITVPAGTPGGDTVYLSGGYDVLGTGIPSSDDWHRRRHLHGQRHRRRLGGCRQLLAAPGGAMPARARAARPAAGPGSAQLVPDPGQHLPGGQPPGGLHAQLVHDRGVVIDVPPLVQVQRAGELLQVDHVGQFRRGEPQDAEPRPRRHGSRCPAARTARCWAGQPAR